MSNGAETPINHLRVIMARLRDPDTGCPWDVRQTFATVAPYTIEEAYEVADAIARQDTADLRDELGDLLLQVVFHARMAEEAGDFTFDDVATAISDKLVRRHPHVFSPDPLAQSGPDSGKDRPWEGQKATERAEKAAASGRPSSALDDVPLALPALARAEKLQRRAARVGFDWPTLAPVLAKLREELAELETEIARVGAGRKRMPDRREDGATASEADARLTEEAGDVLFSVVNLLRHLGLDSEATLRSANAKFIKRFQVVETILAKRGQRPEEVDLRALEACWKTAKNH